MRRLLGVSGALAVALALTVGVALAGTPHSIIDNGTVQLGVHAEGHLNVPGGDPSSGEGTTVVGLRYLPTGAEATAPGCLCEGWGAADAISGVTGYANESSDGGANNMAVVDGFPLMTDTSVITKVDIMSGDGEFQVPVLRVTHDYHPSPVTPNLYEVTVTIENVSSATVEPRYRRVMDWDVEPTAFSEFVTIQGTAAAANVLFASNDGFASANPLAEQSDLGQTGDFVDVGPFDHGALFDFGFDPLTPGEMVTFKTFYGAAADEDGADAALVAVGAEVYSYGQPNTEDGEPPTVGAPNTFIFAFSGVGGEPVIPGDTTICEEGEDCQATASNDEATATVDCDAGQATECGSITLTVDETPQDVCGTENGDTSCEVSGLIQATADEGSTPEEKENTFLLFTLETDPGVLPAPGAVEFFVDGAELNRCRPSGDINDPDAPRPNTTPCIYKSTSPDNDESNVVQVLFRLSNVAIDPTWGAR